LLKNRRALISIIESSSGEFLGIHIGDPQPANLGDGHGWVNETKEFRQDFGDPVRILSPCLFSIVLTSEKFIGAGIETLEGGNHFRYVMNFLFEHLDR
jgi:hypothetical protein